MGKKKEKKENDKTGSKEDAKARDITRKSNCRKNKRIKLKIKEAK